MRFKSAKWWLHPIPSALSFGWFLIPLPWHIISPNFFLIYEKIIPIRSCPYCWFSAVIYLGFSFQRKNKQKNLVQSQIQDGFPDFVVQDLSWDSSVIWKEIVADKAEPFKSNIQLYLRDSCQLELNSIAKADSRIWIRIALILWNGTAAEEGIRLFIQNSVISNQWSVTFHDWLENEK